jgi:hypothetical protein
MATGMYVLNMQISIAHKFCTLGVLLELAVPTSAPITGIIYSWAAATHLN